MDIKIETLNNKNRKFK